MAAENGNGRGGALGWIKDNLISLLVAGIFGLSGLMLKDLRDDVRDMKALASQVKVQENRITSVEKRVDRMEVNYMPWQRVPSRGDAPPDQPPDLPRHGLPADRRVN